MTPTLSDQLRVSRPDPNLPWVLWGGLVPGGGLKRLTFEHYLRSLPARQLERGLIEISEGCTALALQHCARRLDIPVTILCSPEGEATLRARGYGGHTIVPGSLGEALEICAGKRAEGWHWPEQSSNPAIIGAVRAWAAALVEQLREHPEIEVVLCGFGTGASAIGLHQELQPAGYELIALESPPGRGISGWRNYSEQNLGSRDLFHPFAGQIEVRVAQVPREGPPCPREVLLSQDLGIDPSRICVVSHDGVPYDSALDRPGC